jgi:hypothetical protein
MKIFKKAHKRKKVRWSSVHYGFKQKFIENKKNLVRLRRLQSLNTREETLSELLLMRIQVIVVATFT